MPPQIIFANDIKKIMWSKLAPGNAIRTKASVAVCGRSDIFFASPLTQTGCSSQKPSKAMVDSTGDYAKWWWMRSFFDGTIDLSLQADRDGCIVLNQEDAARVREFRNPLRDHSGTPSLL